MQTPPRCGNMRSMRSVVLAWVMAAVLVNGGCFAHQLTVTTTQPHVAVHRDGEVLCETTPCVIEDGRFPGSAPMELELVRGDQRATLVVDTDRFDAAGCLGNAGSTLCASTLMAGMCVGVGLGAGFGLGFVAGPLGIPVPGACGIVGGACFLCSGIANAALAPLSSFVGPDTIDVDLDTGAVRATPAGAVRLVPSTDPQPPPPSTPPTYVSWPSSSPAVAW